MSQKNGSGVYWQTSDAWNSYYDDANVEGTSRFKIEPVTGETYFHLHTQKGGNGYVFSIQPSWSDRSLKSWVDADGPDCRWCFVTEADYQSYLLALDAYASAYGMDLSQSICRWWRTEKFPRSDDRDL